MKWQPIETAPKDGTDILVTDTGSCAVLEWDKEEEHWTNGEMYTASDRLEWVPGTISEQQHPYVSKKYLCLEPTHWMPLPDAPTD